MTITQERRSDLLAAVVGPYSDEPGDIADLVERYYRHVLTEDLVQRRPDDLLGATLSHRAVAGLRRPGRAVVHGFTPTVDATAG